MNLDKYIHFANASFLDFEFDSEGPKGKIRKVARFVEMGPNLYNFGFGDLDNTTGVLNDIIVSNNGDASKILATVVDIINDFTKRFPGAIIFVEGVTHSRTRWYQMSINKNLDEIENNFEIFGYRKEQWEYFQKGQNYEAFFARRRKG
ncbi:MAG: hypothetical protein ABIR18_04590 [Chitinophagaceae bacterium]